MRSKEPRITVFTPAYNRAYIIEKLYHSLQLQKFHDFEWVVVDDGSTDNTEELFDCIQKEENFFPIRYIKTENGGKHRAINKGVSVAKGEVFLIVDSDDHLAADALEKIDVVEKSIPFETKKWFCGVCGQKGYNDETAIGTTFQGEFLDITMLERPQYGISGDKAEAFYTKVLQNYPFPTFDGEKFITECVVWDKIANDGYKMRFYNDISIICNYLPDGLTAQGNTLFERNPKGYGLYLYQSNKFRKFSFREKWSAYIAYYDSLRHKIPFTVIAENLHENPPLLRVKFWGARIVRALLRRARK